jgi:hypothetical protein
MVSTTESRRFVQLSVFLLTLAYRYLAPRCTVVDRSRPIRHLHPLSTASLWAMQILVRSTRSV